MSHLLRLACSADFPAERIAGLPTRVSVSENLDEDLELVHLGIGETLPQGGLFAYLFRRFGYPNRGWDHEKELCSYLLTTTHPGMLMRISPYAGGDTSISFTFLVDTKEAAAARKWETRSRDAWRRDLLDWIEQETEMPEWMADAIQEAQDAHVADGGEAISLTWRNIFDALGIEAYMPQRKGESSTRGDWHTAMIATYRLMVPEPGVDYRSDDWTRWDEADPLKPFARAVVETLAELQRPVWVRDCPITPRGKVSDGEAEAIEDDLDDVSMLDCQTQEEEDVFEDARYQARKNRVTRAAGFPSGDLGNAEPALFGKIHTEILRLGDGNAVLGMTRALEALDAAN